MTPENGEKSRISTDQTEHIKTHNFVNKSDRGRHRRQKLSENTSPYRTMRLYILYGVLVLAVLHYSPRVDATKVKFGPLCSGNPNNNIRGCDSKGCGKFGATRKGKDGVIRKHKGLDIVCNDGSTIYAPFDVKLNGKAVPYSINNAINDGVTMKGEGLCFKLFYVKPDKYSGSLKKGQKIGTLLPMQKVYPGITSHVHVQMCDESDPTKYF